MKARSQIALTEEKHACQNIVTFNCYSIYPFSEARLKEPVTLESQTQLNAKLKHTHRENSIRLGIAETP